MKLTRTCCLLVFVFALAFAIARAQGPVPLPLPEPEPPSAPAPRVILDPTQIQAIIDKWIAVGFSVFASLAALIAYAVGKYQEIKGRLNRLTDRHATTDAKVVDLAQALPPPAAAPPNTPP